MKHALRCYYLISWEKIVKNKVKLFSNSLWSLDNTVLTTIQDVIKDDYVQELEEEFEDKILFGFLEGIWYLDIIYQASASGSIMLGINLFKSVVDQSKLKNIAMEQVKAQFLVFEWLVPWRYNLQQ